MSIWDDMKKSFEEGKAKGREVASLEHYSKKIEEKRALKQEEKERIERLKKEGIPFCPKCKSTSVQYVERRKRLSIGRGIVGATVAGPIGGAVGAVTSKKYKGYIKCLNCGHEWKI